MTARIAVDLLGGEDAPAVVVDGALLALAADGGLRLVFVGPADAVDRAIAAVPPSARDRVTGHRVAGGSPMAAAGVSAAVALVAGGAVDAALSAGPTGASVSAAVRGLGRPAGRFRPGLAVTIPSAAGPVVLLDVGASPDVGPDDLVRYAALGATYARAMHGLARPRVALLSIGAEPGKGDRLRLAAADRLAGGALPADARYVGTVEGHDVPLGGAADVVATDGFTGNVLLKGIEGTVRLAGRPAGATVGGTGGEVTARAAALLGVRGGFVVCHESAGGPDVASGIALAARVVSAGVPGRVAGAHSGAAQPRPSGTTVPARTSGGVRT